MSSPHHPSSREGQAAASEIAYSNSTAAVKPPFTDEFPQEIFVPFLTR